MDNVLRDLFMKADVYSVIFVYNLLSFNKNQDLTPLTDTGLFGALRAIRILVLEFLSKNEKLSRKRSEISSRGHTVLWRTFFQSCIG